MAEITDPIASYDDVYPNGDDGTIGALLPRDEELERVELLDNVKEITNGSGVPAPTASRKPSSGPRGTRPTRGSSALCSTWQRGWRGYLPLSVLTANPGWPTSPGSSSRSTT